MGAAEGNKNAEGNKGGGRKSAYEENEMAERLAEAFFKGVSLKKLNKNAENEKKVKLFELIIFKAIKSEKVLLTLFKKLYPDKTDGKLKADIAHKVQIYLPKNDRENRD